jgi:uncharacterized protein YggU (UPF0235/DUF167 family)
MTKIVVIAKPNQRENCFYWDGKDYRLSIKAKPSDQEANLEAAKILATALEIPKSSIKLVRGFRSRIKQFELNVPADELLIKLNRLTDARTE